MPIVRIRHTRRPNYRMPPGSCDAHCHVIGPAARFPHTADRRGTVADSPKETLAALHARLRLERAVVIQAGAHGTDHRALLDAIASDPYRNRGVARVDESFATGSFEALHRAGVRGVWFTLAAARGGPPDASLFHGVIERIKDLGWHIALDLDTSDIAPLSATLRKLQLPFVIEGMANVPAAAGSDHPDVQALVDLAKADNCWIKVSGAERIADRPYDRAVPVLRALVEASPDRVLWGTGFPYPDRDVDAADLVDLVPWFAITDAQRRKLMVDNPARLYGFAAKSDRITATAAQSALGNAPTKRPGLSRA